MRNFLSITAIAYFFFIASVQAHDEVTYQFQQQSETFKLNPTAPKVVYAPAPAPIVAEPEKVDVFPRVVVPEKQTHSGFFTWFVNKFFSGKS